MPPKGSKKQKAPQPRLEVTKYPLVKNKSSHFGKQIQVPGSHWKGRMSAVEKKTLYLCTVSVIEFEAMHKMPGKSTFEQAFKVQEMGETGTGRQPLRPEPEALAPRGAGERRG